MSGFLRICYGMVIFCLLLANSLAAQQADKSNQSKPNRTRLVRKAQRQSSKARQLKTKAVQAMKGENPKLNKYKKLQDKSADLEQKAEYNFRRAGINKHLKSQTRSTRKRMKLGKRKHTKYKRNTKRRIL